MRIPAIAPINIARGVVTTLQPAVIATKPAIEPLIRASASIIPLRCQLNNPAAIIPVPPAKTVWTIITGI